MKTNFKTFLVLAFLLLSFIANAQIKVHNDGHVSIGSLGKTYGLQVHPSGYVYFANGSNQTAIVTMSNVSSIAQKSWVVKRSDFATPNRFYVDGIGNVYRNASYSLSDPEMQNIVCPIVNPTNSLEQINGFYYTIEDQKGDTTNERLYLGFSAEEIRKIIPEAVETTEESTMYINYDVLTVFLVEAVKEQQKEIEFLRKKLEENGFLK